MTANALSLRTRPVRRRWIVLGLPMGVVAGLVVAIAGPIPIVLAAGGLIAVAATAFTPGIVFALYLLIPFYKGALQPFLPVDITLVLALLNAMHAVPLLLDPRQRRVWWAGTSIWLSVGLMVVAGVIYAPDQQLAGGRAVGYWALVVMPILPAALRVGSDARHVRQMVWSIALAGMAVVVLGMAQVSTSQRLVVLGMNTIQVSRAALMVPLLGATLLLSDRRLVVRLAAVVLMPLAVLVAVASGSRGPLLVVFLMAAIAVLRLLFSFSVLTARRLVIVAIAAATIAVLMAIAPTFVPALSLDRFALLWDYLGSALSGDSAISSGDTSAAARTRLFGLALAMFQDQPLMGAGTAGFEALSPVYAGSIGADAYPHNALLQFAAEYGIVGVALFLGLMATALLRRLPAGRIAMSLRVLAVFFLLNAMLSGNIIEDRMLWALLLLLLVIDRSQLADGPVRTLDQGSRAS